MLCVLPWLIMVVSANFDGWIVDTLVNKGYFGQFVRYCDL